MLASRGLAVTLVAAMGLAVTPASARDVRRCGIEIQQGETGTLVRDVECGYRCTADRSVRCTVDGVDASCPIAGSGCTAETIVLGGNATLDLNGFELSAAYQRDAVVCAAGGKGKCTLRGPGIFRARKGRALTPNDRDVTLKDLTIIGDYKGFGTAGWVRATNVVLLGCSAAMTGESGVRATNVDVGPSCGLLSGKNLYLDHVRVADSIGAAATVRGRDVVVQDGGVFGRDVYLTRAQLPEPLDTALTSYRDNVHAERKLVLRDSVVGGLASGERPRLVDSTCMQSRKTGGDGTWGVCALD